MTITKHPMTTPDFVTFLPERGLFNQFQNLYRVTHFIDKVRPVVEIQEGAKWIPAPADEPLNQFFLHRGMYWQGANRLLTDMWVSYMENSFALVYKFPTVGTISKHMNSTHYRDGAVQFLRVLPKAVIRRMDIRDDFLKGVFIDPQFQGFVSGKTYLDREHFLYVQDFNPIDQFSAPINLMDRLTHAAVPITASDYRIGAKEAALILGMPSELLFESSLSKVQDGQKQLKLLQHYFENTLMPTLEQLKFAFFQLGMANTMRIRFDVHQMIEQWVATWKETEQPFPGVLPPTFKSDGSSLLIDE